MPCVHEQVHNTTAFLILEKLIQHAEAGGRIVKCGDGKTRKVLLLFGQYVTDRQEHEMVLLVKAFGCWHCHCAKADRDDRERVRLAPLKSGREMKNIANKAMATGVYGRNKEWQRKDSQRPKPIYGIPHDSGCADT